MNDKPFGHLTVDADRVAIERGGVYHGGLLLASSVVQCTVAVYDGLDTGGDLIDSFAAAGVTPDRHVFERGIDLRVGLYVDLGANVSKFTVYYEPPTGQER
jgi:hypothetical protein